MYTKPSIIDLIQAALDSLSDDIAPELPSARAQACLMMVKALLQGAIQRIGSEQPLLITEHNEMTALFRALAERLADSGGPPAERIRQRGVSLGGCADIPMCYPQKELAAAHHRLSQGLVETLVDLDQLLTTGEARAEESLRLLRGHLALRSAREFQALTVSSGPVAGRE